VIDVRVDETPHAHIQPLQVSYAQLAHFLDGRSLVEALALPEHRDQQGLYGRDIGAG
jgi:hypothetical protein